MKALVLGLGLALAMPAVASANDTPAAAVKSTAVAFELIDRGTAVEVIARNVKAARTGLVPTRSRLEVPVVGFPRATPKAAKDQTVVSAELSGGANRRVLSVKTVFDRADVRELARFAQAIQVGDDLHVIIPRVLPAAGSTVVLPEPTLSPELAAKVAAAAPHALAAPAPTPIAPVITPSEIAAAAKPAPEAAAPAPVAAPTHEAPKPAKLGGAKETGGNNKLVIYGIAALALIAAGSWILKKKKAAQAPGNQIEVIAQRVIGPKAKIVWLSAGSREMLVAVTAQQVRMLGTWKKGEAPPAALPEAQMLDGGKHAREARTSRPLPRIAESAAPASPAIAGLLKLRGKQSEQLVSADVATGELEADAQWAKEIMNATAGFRR